MTVAYEKSFAGFERYLSDYKPQLEKAIAAIQTLETAHANSNEICDALAELQVCATVLEPYSKGLLEAINCYTDETSE